MLLGAPMKQLRVGVNASLLLVGGESRHEPTGKAAVCLRVLLLIFQANFPERSTFIRRKKNTSALDGKHFEREQINAWAVLESMTSIHPQYLTQSNLNL